MIEFPFTLPVINPEGLDAALRSGLAAQYLGLSTYGKSDGTVFLVDTAQPADLSTAQSIVAAHDPNALTPDQQIAKQSAADKATIAQQLDTQIASLKAMNPTDLASAIASIKQIAHVEALILSALRDRWS